MKKISSMLAVALIAGMASAVVIWENDFNSPNTFFDPPVNPVDMHNGRDDAWLGAGTVSITTGNEINIRSGGSGQTRGLVRALTTNNVVSNAGSGSPGIALVSRIRGQTLNAVWNR